MLVDSLQREAGSVSEVALSGVVGKSRFRRNGMPVGLYSHTMPSAVTGARQKPFGSKCADDALQFCLSPGATTIRTRENGRGPVYCQVLAVSTPLFAYQPLGPKCERKAAEGRYQSRGGQVSGRYGQVSRRYGQVSRRYGQVSRRYGQVSRRYGQVSRRYGQVSRRYGQVSRRYGQVSRRYGQVSRRYGQVSRRYGQVSRRYGQVSRRYGQVLVDDDYAYTINLNHRICQPPKISDDLLAQSRSSTPACWDLSER